MKKIFFIFLILAAVIIIKIFILSYKEKPLSLSQTSKVLNTENINFFPENTVIFLNNIKLLDNYLNFKETEFFKKLIEIDLFNRLDIDKKIYTSGSRAAFHIKNELTFENLINLIGNNISFGVTDYNNDNNHKFLLVLNLFQQGQFFDKLFELLESENITRNTKYSYRGVTIKIVESKKDSIFFDKLYYMEYNNKFLFTSSKEWLEDIISNNFGDKTINDNPNFNKLIRNISMDFTSLFFFDIEKILKYAEHHFLVNNQKDLYNAIQNYKIIEGYLIVNDLLTSENLITYGKDFTSFDINSYLGRPKTINLLKLLPLKSLFTFSLTSFDLNEYLSLIFDNVMKLKNETTTFKDQITKFNELLNIDIQKDFFSLMKGEFNLTVKDMVYTDNLPVIILKIETARPNQLYKNLVETINKSVEKHDLNFYLYQETYENFDISYLQFNLPDYALAKTGFLKLDNYLIFFYGDNIVQEIYEISENMQPSILDDKIFVETGLEKKKVNIVATINTKRGLDILQDILNEIISLPVENNFLKNYNIFYHIDPVFDLLKTLDGFVLYSVKEDNNIIRNIAKFGVEE